MPAKAQNNNAWVKVSDKNGIAFYQKDTINIVKEFKAEFTVNATYQQVENILLNVDNYKEWVSSLKEINQIKKVNDSLYYHHLIIKVYPFIHRECITNFTIKEEYDGASYNLKIDTIAYQHTLQAKRIKYFRAHWKLQKITEKKIKVEFQFNGIADNYYDFVYPLIDRLMLISLQNITGDFIESVNN